MAEQRPEAFSYHRAVAPLMWVFVGLASIELVVVHLLVAMWRPRVALALSALSLLSMLWLVSVIRSFKRLPVVIEQDRLVVRVGTLKRIDVPRGRVTGLRETWNAADLKARGVLKLSLIAYPNVVIDIDPPVGRRGLIRAVSHRLDDPASFAQALSAWLAPSSSDSKGPIVATHRAIRGNAVLHGPSVAAGHHDVYQPPSPDFWHAQ